jgi:uncharacterized membrane protein YhaH (DUF805 family)
MRPKLFEAPAFVAALAIMGALGALFGELLASESRGWLVVVAVVCMLAAFFGALGVLARRKRSRLPDERS